MNLHPSPGSYAPPNDRWGPFTAFAPGLPSACLAVVDRVVARKHPGVVKALKADRARTVLLLEAGEESKSFSVLEKVLQAGAHLPRSASLVCVGGGTLGDLSTVAAHLFKRGIRLVQVPSTLLAAVDSSVGGKGAVDLRVARRIIKNAAGVFHYASESWLCPELFESLSPRQLREGAIEAWKMAVCLDADLYETYCEAAPPIDALIKDARRIKSGVCAQDPYERTGLRAVLNFGHTFG
ncbi:MAG TPA: 3-dehydroquinate synthase, partial [Myxococcaceae bacterium]|nr:3-dehydroquinate synthase [Myxococcaceae bacterium]